MVTEFYTYYTWAVAAFIIHHVDLFTFATRLPCVRRENRSITATLASNEGKRRFDWQQRMRGRWRNSLKVGIFIKFLSFLRGKTEVKFKQMPSGHGHIPKETFCIENVLPGELTSEEIDDKREPQPNQLP